MKIWLSAVVESLRLAVAVLLYTVIEPTLKDIVPSAPIVGESVAAILCASAVLIAGWIVMPFGRVMVVIERFANNVPYPGPQIELTCKSYVPAVAHYGLRVHYDSYGLVGQGLGHLLARRGVELAFTINSNLLILHSESAGADEERLDDGVVIALSEKPSRTTWQYVTVSVDSKEVPGSVDLDVGAKLLYPAGKPWYSFLVWPASRVKTIKLMHTGGRA